MRTRTHPGDYLDQLNHFIETESQSDLVALSHNAQLCFGGPRSSQVSSDPFSFHFIVALGYLNGI